jgi:hypothetical protein
LPESLVTAYPMKAERKKAREELDIVNVVEWQSEKERFFLLVRRPEGGRLLLKAWAIQKRDFDLVILLKVFWLVCTSFLHRRTYLPQ